MDRLGSSGALFGVCLVYRVPGKLKDYSEKQNRMDWE